VIQLHPYQRPAHDALVTILSRHRSALDASDLGTGKTYVAVKVAETLGLCPMVVCPKAVVPAWETALRASSVSNWSVGSWEYLRTKQLPVWRNFWIFDEVQKAKGRTSKNAKLMLAAAKLGKVLCLSATAASNPLEMYALGAILDLYAPGTYWSWVKEHGCKKGFFGGMVYQGGVEGMSRIHGKIFPHRGVRLRIADLPDFPECDTQADILDIGDPAEEMAAELAEVDQRAALDKDPENPLTQQTRERERTELSKVPLLIELIEEAADEGKSIAVFANFNSTLRAIAARLKIRSDFYTGEHLHSREQAKQRFQINELPVLLINIKAGGVGLSLHDLHGGHPRLALICPTFSVQDYRQALGRIHRNGAKTKAVQKIIFAAGTVEERVAKLLRKKEMNLDALNDADLVKNQELDTASACS
jgi:hypothetical protein